MNQLAIKVGKPITQAEAEVNRAIALLQSVAQYADEPLLIAKDEQVYYRYRAVGTIALITPWNNPLAIPIGKIAPALLYGNTIVWKPAPAGSSIALKLMELLREADSSWGSYFSFRRSHNGSGVNVGGHDFCITHFTAITWVSRYPPFFH